MLITHGSEADIFWKLRGGRDSVEGRQITCPPEICFFHVCPGHLRIESRILHVDLAVSHPQTSDICRNGHVAIFEVLKSWTSKKVHTGKTRIDRKCSANDGMRQATSLTCWVPRAFGDIYSATGRLTACVRLKKRQCGTQNFASLGLCTLGLRS